MSILMPKLRTRDLPGALDWIERVTTLFETQDLAGLTTTEEAPEAPTFTFVDAGVVASGADIDLMAANAALLDILLVCDPFDNPTYTGSGWFTGSQAWTNYGYTARWRWKQLNALTNVTRGVASYNAGWVLIRGAVSLTLMNYAEGAGTDITFDMGALDGTHVGHVAWITDRNGLAAGDTIVDWDHVLAAAPDGTFTHDIHTRSPGVPGLVTFDGFAAGFDQVGFGFEARSA